MVLKLFYDLAGTDNNALKSRLGQVNVAEALEVRSKCLTILPLLSFSLQVSLAEPRSIHNTNIAFF